MKIHGIELTGSLHITGSSVGVSGSLTSTASFGTLTVAGFGGDSNLVDFSSSLASRIASSEAGGVTSVTGGDGLTDSGTNSKTLNVVGGTGIVANTNDVAIDFSDSTLQSNVSGAFVAASGSIATEINALQAASGGFSTRLTTAEDELAETLVSASAQLAANVSGAFAADSASIATDIDALQARVTTEEGNVDTLQARDIIAGTGLTGGGTLAADRTLNVVGGTGITANANDIEVDFSDSTLQSTVSGAFAAASSSIATEINALQAGGGEFNAGDSGSIHTRLTAAETELENTLVSQSAQIASEVSGAFAASSGSIATDIDALQARMTTAESELGNTLVSSSAQLASDISGAFTAGTGLDLSSGEFSVDVSDFMANGSNNRLLTATGADGQNAEANLTFDGTSLGLTGNMTASGNISGSVTSTGSFGRVQASIIGGNSPLKIESDNFNVSTAGVVNAASISATSFSGVFTNVVSSSAQIASDISGSFGAASSSIATEINALQAQGGTEFTVGDSGSISSRLTTAEDELAESLVSASAQLASNVSGAFVAPSASIATDIDALQARVTTAESELGNTLISSSAQIASDISGSFTGGFNYVGKISGSLVSTGSFGRVEVGGHVVPNSNFEVDLGSPTNAFRDLYVSSASIFMDGQKIISSDATNLDITTTSGQNLRLIETDSDDLVLQTAAGDLQLQSTSGKIELNGAVEVLAGKKINASDGNNIHFGDGLSVSGSIHVRAGSNIVMGTGDLVDGVDLSVFSSSAAAEINELQAAGFTSTDSASLSSRITAAESELALPLISGSAQIASQISGAFVAPSSSIATEINALQTDSGSFSTRLTTAEDELAETLVSQSAQIASEVSGAFSSASGSIATDIDALQARMTTEEGNVDTLQARDIIAGTGLTGGGTLAADRTLNVVGGTGITANANDIEVDFSDSTLQSTVSGAFSAPSASIATDIDAVQSRLSANGVESSVVHNQSVASARWAVTHSLDNQYPTITVWGANDMVVVPATIKGDNANQLTITFNQAIAGKAVMR